MLAFSSFWRCWLECWEVQMNSWMIIVENVWHLEVGFRAIHGVTLESWSFLLCWPKKADLEPVLAAGSAGGLGCVEFDPWQSGTESTEGIINSFVWDSCAKGKEVGCKGPRSCWKVVSVECLRRQGYCMKGGAFWTLPSFCPFSSSSCLWRSLTSSLYCSSIQSWLLWVLPSPFSCCWLASTCPLPMYSRWLQALRSLGRLNAPLPWSYVLSIGRCSLVYLLLRVPCQSLGLKASW